MKTPINMLENIEAEVIENTSLLEVIYRDSNENVETDCAIACLIRSLYKTKEKIAEYVELLGNTENTPTPAPPEHIDITDDIFYATLSAAKLRELAHIYNESYFSKKSSNDGDCLMAALVLDNAIKVHDLLKHIEDKLN